ncbi:uncharacterized protein G2W53_043223 [Senna tora]|uniref:Uncharacterized protein n=1 Tax=Senna tora TaxID=362788 RepID=A0A834W035_9FABA|nr:uncharacterized protein G2W53_043223 [Senna tora]
MNETGSSPHQALMKRAHSGKTKPRARKRPNMLVNVTKQFA